MSRSTTTYTHKPKGVTGRVLSTPGFSSCVEIDNSGIRTYRYVYIKRNGHNRKEPMNQTELIEFVNDISWPTYYIDKHDNFIVIRSGSASGSPHRGASQNRSPVRPGPAAIPTPPTRSTSWNVTAPTSLNGPVAQGFNPIARRGTH